MNAIRQSQFDVNKYSEFKLNRVFQCAYIEQFEADVEIVRRGLTEEAAWRSRNDKKTWIITFGPVVVGEATAVTDHIDVYQYYCLDSEPKKD